MKTLYFIIYFFLISTIFIVGTFFISSKVYGVDLSPLSSTKISELQDEFYIVDLMQSDYFDTHGKYTYLEKYTCGNYECEVYEYLAPPYTENDRGYIIFVETAEEIVVNSTGIKKPYIDNIYEKIIFTSTTTDNKF